MELFCFVQKKTVTGIFPLRKPSTKSIRDPEHKVTKELLLWLPC